MSSQNSGLNARVFVNCAFDAAFLEVFRAIVFAVKACGFQPRTALDESDFGQVRIAKISDLIFDCDRGIHDLSAVELDAATGMPRFNMPLELGMSLGLRLKGPKSQRRKRILVLDAAAHQYDMSTSDISGQDLRAHGRDPKRAIGCVRDWLAQDRDPALAHLPGEAALADDYAKVRKIIDETIREHRLNPWDRLSHPDFIRCLDAGLVLLSGASLDLQSVRRPDDGRVRHDLKWTGTRAPPTARPRHPGRGFDLARALRPCRGEVHGFVAWWFAPDHPIFERVGRLGQRVANRRRCLTASTGRPGSRTPASSTSDGHAKAPDSRAAVAPATPSGRRRPKGRRPSRLAVARHPLPRGRSNPSRTSLPRVRPLSKRAGTFLMFATFTGQCRSVVVVRIALASRGAVGADVRQPSHRP